MKKFDKYAGKKGFKKDNFKREPRDHDLDDERPRPAKKDFNKRDFGKRDFNPKDRFVDAKAKTAKSGFELYEATCDKCGRKCDLPFKPTGGKPIYCRSCFRQQDGNDSRPGNDRFQPRSRDNNSGELEQINRKLDKIMRALKID